MIEQREGLFKAAGGINIFYRYEVPENPRANLIIIHGVAEHSGRYQHVISRYAGKGYACFAMDWRGLGQSEGHRGHVDRIGDMLDDIARFVDLVREKSPGKPQFLLGHSVGGLLVLASAIRRPGLCAGVIASSPYIENALKVPAWKTHLAGLLSVVAPRVGITNEIPPGDVSRSPEVVDSYANDPLRYGKVTPRFFMELNRCMGETRQGAGRLTMPMLLMQAGADRIALPQGGERFAGQVGAADRQFVMFDGLFHELFNEPEKEQVFDCMDQWLEKHLDQGVMA